MRHKADKSNIVPDALSRLQADVATAEKVGVLEALYGSPIELCDGDVATETLEILVHHITLVEMVDDFKDRLRKAYQDEPHWAKILAMVKPKSDAKDGDNPPPATGDNLPSLAMDVANLPPVAEDVGASPSTATSAATGAAAVPEAGGDASSSRPGLRFKYRNGLIYFTAGDGRDRLCIPALLEQEIFQLAHDQTHHGGFHRTYDRIAPSVYIHQLAKRLRTYISHCPECQLNQTKRHLAYGELSPVVTPAIPFHTIAMDWIVALPVTKAGFNQLLTITCKFTKRILLIAGKDTWKTPEWADVMITGLVGHDWGTPRVRISDRDTRFMSDFWRAVVRKLGIFMMIATAYHHQANGQSERTNQVIEIALRFHLTAFPDDDWIEILPYLQAENNNVK